MDLLRRIFDITEDRHPEILDELIRENRIQANLYTAKAMLFMAAGFIVALIMNHIEFFGPGDRHKTIMYLCAVVLLIGTAVICYKRQGSGKALRIIMMVEIILCSGAVAILNVYGFWACFVFAIGGSCRYYDRLFTVIVSLVAIAAAILAQYAGVIYGMSIGSLDVSAFEIPEGAEVTVKDSLATAFRDEGYLSVELIISYILGQVLNIFLVLGGLAYIAYKISKHGKMAMIEAANLNADRQEAALRAEEMRTKMMISQIQPHFLYNSLTAIMAIDDNPPETVDAIADFSMYLRENLNVLTINGNIPFEREMDHVERYVDLERLRFGPKLRVEYDIRDVDFDVPPLTVQMLVENSVKHGVTIKRSGGTIKISSCYEDGYHVIKIIDDGKGFDVEATVLDEHVGIGSVRKRVTDMGGRFEIHSAIGEGTEAGVYIPVEDNGGEE